MLLLAPLLQQPPIQRLDALAQSRDVDGLNEYLAAPLPRSPFSILKTGGAYIAGAKGWHAKSLQTPDGASYVVFSTPLISEDAGELLFRVNQAGKLEYVPESDSLGVQLDRHSFDLRFDLAGARAILTDNLQCHWTGAPKSHFVFRLSPTFTVRSITDRTGGPVPFRQAGGIVAVAPTKAPLTFKIKYDGTVEMPGFDRQISNKEATLSGAVWYPMIARQPTPYDIAIHYRKDWSALAQGNLIGTETTAKERITRYRMDVPVVWYAATAGPYKTESTVIRGRQYAVMSSSMTREQMQLQNVLNSDIVDFYSTHFRPYPFKRWTSLDSWQFHGGPGALEAYSFATYPGGLPERDAHEPSHTWWGGILDNDYLRSLWNESFANYCPGLYARNQPYGKKGELQLAYLETPFVDSIYNAAPLTDSGVEIGPAAAAMGYGKGAYVLQMLEDEIGTDAMIRSMSQWVRTNPPRHIGRWEDFEATVNRVTGVDYSWFFDEWARRPGYANLSLSDVVWQGGQLSGKLIFKGDPYRMHLDLLIEMADGSRRFGRIETTNQSEGRFEVNCPDRPALISLDPWQKALRNRASSERRVTLEGNRRVKWYLDPTHKDYLSPLGASSMAALPSDLAGVGIIGHPDTTPAMRDLCKRAGFEVSGQTLTYNGTKIDLDHGGALAVLDLPDGKHTVIALGKAKFAPDLGQARLLVYDEYGRTLRALTDPVEAGPLAYRFESLALATTKR